MTGKSKKYVWTGILYFMFVLMFGVLYSYLYSSQAGHFIFNADILKTRAEEIRELSEPKIEKWNTIRPYIEKALHDLQTSEPDAVSFTAVYPKYVAIFDGFHLEFHLEEDDFASTLQLRVNGERPQYVRFADRLASLSSEGDWIAYLVESKEKNDAHVAPLKLQLETLADVPQDVWGFVDFVYFSLITQTTVGYGDVIPNSRSVRLWVMLQVVIGITFFLVVVHVITHDDGGA